MEKILGYLARHRRLTLAAALVVAVVVAVFVHAGTTDPISSYADCVEAGNPILETDPPICRDGTRNFTGTPEPEPSAGPAVTSLPFEILVDGDTRSQLPAEHQDVVLTQVAWQNFWQHEHAGLPTLPPLIPVDFSSSSVVAVNLGPQPTTGFGLKITNITTSATGTIVSFTKSAPTITCAVAQQLTNRYLIVRTSKLGLPVSFRQTTEMRHCP